MDERLSEIDFGELEGRKYEEIEREQPELFRRWMESPTQVRFPGGESWRTCARVRATPSPTSSRRAATQSQSSHTAGLCARSWRTRSDLPDERAFALDVGYARVSIVDWYDSSSVVRLVNGVAADVPDALGG